MRVDELRQELQDVAARTPDAGADARATVMRRGRRLVRHKRYGQTTMIIAIAAVLIAGLFAIRGDNDPTGKTILTTPTTTPTKFAQSTGVEVLPPPPLSTRTQEAVVWTGSELAVWGGNLDAANMRMPGPDRAFNDGSYFSPQSRTWTAMAASPLPATAEQAVGAATNDGVVFARGTRTALWEPARNEWRTLGDAPLAVTDMTSTGSEIVSASANAMLNPRTGTWRALPDPPVTLDQKAIAWTGHELVVLGGIGTPFTRASGLALDPEQREWRRIADLPPDMHAEALSADWDGRRLVVVNYDMRAAAYDPTRNTWQILPAAPARFSEWYPTLKSAGGYTAAFMAQSVAVLTPAGAWVPMPYGFIPFGTIASTRPAFVAQPADDSLFVLGARDTNEPVLVALDLGRLVATASRLQVGIAGIEPGPGYGMTASHYDVKSEAVTIELRGPNGGACAIESIYDYPQLPNLRSTPIRVSLPTDGRATTWHRNAEGTVWRHGSNGSDTFTVSCTDAAAARALAVSASFR